VVGGGRVAQRKVKGLLACEAQLTVISPELTDELQAMWGRQEITWQERSYQDGDLQGAFLVIAATDDAKVQEMVHQEAEARNIILNVADVPDKCSFILPALIKRGDLTIAVSTAGKSPAMAKTLRQHLEQELGIEYAVLVDVLGLTRPEVLARGRSQKENEDVFNRIIASDILERLKAKDWQGVEEILEAVPGLDLTPETMAAVKGIVMS